MLQSRSLVPVPDLPLEFLMNALRLTDGFAPGLFEARTGLAFADCRPRLHRAAQAGLLRLSPDHVAPTLAGHRFLNRLLADFIA
jgi:oxygen-independent coproporphyrinogen-3 oxidase